MIDYKLKIQQFLKKHVTSMTNNDKPLYMYCISPSGWCCLTDGFQPLMMQSYV